MSKPSCFIIMPITTPAHYVEQYKGDGDHFKHVLDHLFKPAIDAAGMEPIAPIVKGSEIIHGEIIKNIETADLVLCDMSILNPNVFFELGIRTALNKSVAMVKDDVTGKIPFDTGIINHHTYNSDGLTAWDMDAEIKSLKTHLEDCMNNGEENALWGYFSMSQQAVVPSDAPDVDKKLGYLIKQVESLSHKVNKTSIFHREEPNFYGDPNSLIARIKVTLLAWGLKDEEYRLIVKGSHMTLATINALDNESYETLDDLCLKHGFKLAWRSGELLGLPGNESI